MSFGMIYSGYSSLSSLVVGHLSVQLLYLTARALAHEVSIAPFLFYLTFVAAHPNN